MRFELQITVLLLVVVALATVHVASAQEEEKIVVTEIPPRTTSEAAAAGLAAVEVKERTLGLLGWMKDLVRGWKASPTVLNDSKAKNALLKLNGKTAIVFGGTSGIGHSLAVRFAQAGSNVYIVGRSEKAAAAILEEMKGFNVADATYRFVASDLSLLGNARAAVKQLPEELKVVDYVVFCQTKATIQGRTPTIENIDEKLALNYFSRVELVRQLLPRLEASEDARVMSVLSAGVHAPHADYKTDFALENYSQKKAADTAGFYTDLAFDHLSRQHPKVTFIHAAPGFVSTNWGTDMPAALRLPIRALQATVAKASSDCAEFLLPSLTQPDQRGNGKVHLIGEYGQDVATTKLHTDEAVAFVWQATERVVTSV